MATERIETRKASSIFRRYDFLYMIYFDGSLLRQTCRLRKRSTFDTLGEAFACYFKQQSPDLEWIRQPVQA